VNAVAPLTSAIDGFILTIYFGRGTSLEVGDAVVNINLPGLDGRREEFDDEARAWMNRVLSAAFDQLRTSD